MYLLKILTDQCFQKQNIKIKNTFACHVYKILVLKKYSYHRKQCLLINGCQAVNYESGIIKFTNYNKQIPILFKIYADTECFFKRTKIEEGEYTTKYEEHQLNSIRAKLVWIDDRFTLEQNTKTKNTMACLVYKILLQKKYYLVTKNNVY